MAIVNGSVMQGDSKLDTLVEKKATCPFLGSAIATGKLPIRDQPPNFLASVQDVIELGNTGKGDLGKVLGFFARGNHGKMRGPAGAPVLDTPVPPGLFSLDLPGSQGSHHGHSGILQGDPTQLDSGRFSPEDFKRLEGMSPNRFIKRSDIARFIAGNFKQDPHAASLPLRKWAQEAVDLSIAALRRLDSQTPVEDQEIEQSFASILGGNHLLASSGEFGLLLAFLHGSPNTRHDQDPVFSMDEITMMFRDKKLPEGWEEWEKTARNWILHTFKLASRAVIELVRMEILENSVVERTKMRILEIFDGARP